MNNKLNKAMQRFLKMINNSWVLMEDINKEDVTGSFKDDWLQSNWELIVENAVTTNNNNIVLEVYGDGGDANGDSSRILYPKLLPNKKVICVIKEKNCKDYLNEKLIATKTIYFDRFVTFRDGWYFEEPPFNMVLAYQDDKEIIVGIDNIYFDLIDV